VSYLIQEPNEHTPSVFMVVFGDRKLAQFSIRISESFHVVRNPLSGRIYCQPFVTDKHFPLPRDQNQKIHHDMKIKRFERIRLPGPRAPWFNTHIVFYIYIYKNKGHNWCAHVHGWTNIIVIFLVSYTSPSICVNMMHMSENHMYPNYGLV